MLFITVLTRLPTYTTRVLDDAFFQLSLTQNIQGQTLFSQLVCSTLAPTCTCSLIASEH